MKNKHRNIDPDFYYGASPVLFKLARELRQNSTEAEMKLWKALRNRKLLNLKFRRQHPIDSYIVDFYCHEKKIIIEVDGNIHNLPDEKKFDQFRENKLKQLGLNIVRFKNEEVLNNLDSVLKKLHSFIKAI